MFKIAIPTYHRPNKLLTLSLAEKIVGAENVYVFFHNQEDYENYKINYKILNPIITNQPVGIAKQRNAILNNFSNNDEIVMMDDDMTEIYKKQINDLKKLEPNEIKEEFKNAFSVCRQNKCYLWGIYPIKDAFFMKNKISNKCLMIGWIMGIIVNDLRFDENFPTKEDYDYGLQNLVKYKKLARLDYLTCNCKFKSSVGGLSEVYGTEKETEAYLKILNKWSHIVQPNPKKENEVILKI